jgi:cbb3-type cytochrome oxidase subunit 3
MPIIQWLQHHSTLLMLIVFLLIVLSTYRPGRKKAIEKYGQIPLADDR